MDASIRNARGGGSGVSAVVEYDYAAKEPDEIDLIKGTIINNIKQMPGGWWEGTVQSNGKTGMFPDNFVRIIDINDENTVILRDKSTTAHRRCKVIYSYTQVNDDELSLAVGDVIEFLGEVEEGWWRGRLKNKIGVFPSNFVVAIEPSPILASKRPPSSSMISSSAAATNVSTSTAAKTATATAAANAAAVASAISSSTRKTNRLSFHSSKEDLLNSSSKMTSSSAAVTTTAPVDDAAPSLPPKPQRDYCRVEFPYAPQNDDELELKVGDIITVISTELPDKGWWKGEIRGKVGVFPDNFVKMLSSSDVAPLNDTTQPSHRTVKTSNAGNSHAASTTAIATSSHSSNITSVGAASSSSSSSQQQQQHPHIAAANTSAKVVIKKSGSTSSTHSSNRKDSFGSRDSLNDILSETGLPSGNVAAQRKSLENKNLDLSTAPDASTRIGLKKLQTNSSNNSNNSNNITTTTTTTTGSLSTNELRKSLENMDEKTKTPPPVLTKKPNVPSKKTTSVTSVAGNILSGLKQKVKNVENKLTTAASHDYADGVCSSRMSPGALPDSGSGNVVMRRAATIAVEDTDFDRVERASILSDMRAGRVKAPKRRPPSAAINVIGESNNNNSVYLNGSNGSAAELSQSDDGKLQSSDENSTGEEQLAKPKPREWQKKKAPWMEELKASQEKMKTTSPNVEPRSGLSDRTSKLLSSISGSGGGGGGNDTKITNSSHIISSTSNSVTSTTKVQSSSISSSSSSNIMQQSMMTESSQQSMRSEALTKSMNSKIGPDGTTIASSSTTTTTTAVDDVRVRPNSLSIRNRSISPSLSNTRSASKTSASPATTEVAAATTNNSSAAKTSYLNSHENNITAKSAGVTATAGTDSVRVIELERRVDKLEAVVHAQQRTIDELVRTLREETDRVKVLRGELDKYAQCVTQV